MGLIGFDSLFVFFGPQSELAMPHQHQHQLAQQVQQLAGEVAGDESTETMASCAYRNSPSEPNYFYTGEPPTNDFGFLHIDFKFFFEIQPKHLLRKSNLNTWVIFSHC